MISPTSKLMLAIITNRKLEQGLERLMFATFIPLILMDCLLIAGGQLGYEIEDPVQSDPKEINSMAGERQSLAAYVPSAAKKSGETYLGFEVMTRKPVYLGEEERNKHIQVVGSTGSGKTRFTLFPMIRQDIEAGRGVVFIDAKGSAENARIIYSMVKAAKREKDFLFFSLTDLEHSSTYNPLQHGNPSQLKDKIAASIDWSEPFYQRVCESALQTLFIVDLDRVDQRVTLSELHAILKDPPGVASLIFRRSPPRKMRNISKRFSVRLITLVNTPLPVPRLLSEQVAGIDLLDVYQNKRIAYFALDTQSYLHTAMRVGKMITQDINTLSGLVESRFNQNDKKFLAIYIDEFQAFGTKGFINALARGRASGFWITIAHQSLGDLKSIDEAYAQQVMENTNTKVFLRINDPETAQLFCDSVGTKKNAVTTSQVLIHGADPKNIVGSRRVVHEYIIHPTELKTLDPGQAVFKSGKRHGRWGL